MFNNDPHRFELSLDLTSKATNDSYHSMPIVPGYVLEKQLNYEGVGAIYFAYDQKRNQQVLLKILPMIKDERFHQKFCREMQTIASLSHPGFTKVFNYGTHNEIIYVSMQITTGNSLQKNIAQSDLTIKLSVKIVMQICDALAYLHQHEIIHRGLKPNAVVMHNDQPVIADFIVAKQRASLSGKNDIPISYMSPEQLNGHRVDKRSDIYALGSIFYEMLTGATVVPNNRHAALKIMARKRFTPLRKLNPAIAKDLEKICLKAVAVDKNKRYQNIEDLQEDLQLFVNKEPLIHVKTQSFAQLVPGFVMGIVVALLFFYIIEPTQPKQTDKNAIVNNEKEEQGTLESSQSPIVPNKLYKNSRRMAKRYFIQGNSALRQRNLAQALQHFTNAIKEDPQYDAAYERRGFTRWRLKNFSQAIQDHSKAIKLNDQFAMAYYNRGYIHHVENKNLVAGITDYTKTIEIDPEHPEAYHMRGNAYVEMQEWQAAIKDYDRFLILVHRSQEPHHIQQQIDLIRRMKSLGPIGLEKLRQWTKLSLRQDVRNQLHRALSDN